MKKKTEQAIEAFENGRQKEALLIASTFRIGLTKEERDALIRGYECLVHPQFYRMIGKEPAEEISKGIQVFQEKVQKPYQKRTVC